jgi:hypothetical protein
LYSIELAACQGIEAYARAQGSAEQHDLLRGRERPQWVDCGHPPGAHPD